MSVPAMTACSSDVAIIGGGPAGLFAAFELGLLGLSTQVVDALPELGGQCAALYADKPIYDIPGIPRCTGRELVAQLLQQLKPFAPRCHLGQLVEQLSVNPNAPAHRFELRTDQGTVLQAHAVVLATGTGAFLPRKPAWPQLEDFERRQQVRYHAPPRTDTAEGTSPPWWAGQRLVVVGDDDLALSTALRFCGEAAETGGEAQDAAPRAREVTLLHRRDRWRAEPSRVAAIHAAHQAGRLRLVFGQVSSLKEAEGSRSVLLNLTRQDGLAQEIIADCVFPLLGLSPQLGPLMQWGLPLEHKLLPVNPATFETSMPGIHAIGDIVHYPGKRKLILSGFHEATLAAYAIAEQLTHQGQALPVLYTTSSSLLQQRLGV